MSVFSRLSAVSRDRKLRLFQDVMRPQATCRILDVGGEANGTLELLDTYPWPHQVSLVNVQADHVAAVRCRYPEVDARTGDARRLPWPDKAFDIVYSNAVIEHVGTWADQQAMAREIMRVGKCWFVTTPNRWYPFEFHMRLPFVPWLPRIFQPWCGRIVQYGHIKHRYVFGVKAEAVRLLSVGDLRRLFPGSRIIRQRVTFMPETLIVVGGEPAFAAQHRLIPARGKLAVRGA